MSILNPSYEGKVHKDAATKELKIGGICSKYLGYKLSNWHTIDLTLKRKLQKQHFWEKYDCFLASYVFILDPCYDGDMRRFAKTEELKKKEFTINSQNITQENDIHLNFMLEINLHY